MKNGTIVNISSTNGTKTISPEYIAEETAKIYIERFADPSEIANTIYFLSSDKSSYINSEILVIDGGY